MKLTVAVLHCISSRHQISLLSFRCSHSQDKSSPSKMYSHGTSRPKSPPLLTGFPFMTTFPQLVCLFKILVNQVAFNLAIILGEFKGNLCTAVTLYITVTWPFPKGDRYIRVWLYIPRELRSTFILLTSTFRDISESILSVGNILIWRLQFTQKRILRSKEKTCTTDK